MELVICTIVFICFLCTLICLFPVRSQTVHRSGVSGRYSEAKRMTAHNNSESQPQKKSVPNKKHVSFLDGDSDNAQAKPHSERQMAPNKRHSSYTAPESGSGTPTAHGNENHDNTEHRRRPLHNSYVMVKNAEPSPSSDSYYSRESTEERLSKETMARYATNTNYTSSLNKFIEFQERDFLDTVKVGDPNVRPVGGSFGCKIPLGSI